ncbi:alpha/beta fold hydrolase [Actinomadura parmotrematis]|uniref:Alpha/beta fold hydrolase n=1 Tax=Actinomadura parmotrematis TaxID=2864039 RepID=A0ABS7G215_9ACTN|nr:alpha/beta fold hydrolase [Actinomadura parmotrematis]MBW8485877.1 alpha/beta fold hydrolase [Actinomadura parmotrematis]
MTVPATTFGYAATPRGRVHYAEHGAGPPVVLLHQSPRSWDEFREVLPILGARHRAIAPDLIGFGASARGAEHSIASYAAGVLDLLDALGLETVDLAGHHTGGVVALEVAAAAPARVRRLVLSSTPYLDAAARARRKDRPAVDEVAEKPDGSHLTELWNRRTAFYPPDRPDLLTRFVRDALAVWPDVEAGHRAVSAYRMEERIGLVGCATLCVGASADPFAFPDLEPLAAHLADAATAVIEGGMVPLEYQAGPFAHLVLDFLR